MASVAELRAKIASGEIKPFTGGGGMVGAGTFDVMIESVTMGRSNSGNPCGQLVCKVVTSEDPVKIGRKFNYSLQTVNVEYCERQLAEFAQYCQTWGIDENRIYDRAETLVDIISNLCGEMQRLAVRGQLFAQIERIQQTDANGVAKLNAKSRKPMFWNNIKSVCLGQFMQASAPTTVQTLVQAPASAPTMASMPAPVVQTLAPAPTTKKPWQV